MNRFRIEAEGFIECVTVMLPDLKFWERHSNFDDHFWYAERVNGRIAMLTLSTLLVLEAVTHQSIWELIHVF